MTDHRRIQRTLFRMQHDPAFARALRSGDASAGASTGLGAEDLRLLLATPPEGIEADAGGRRRAQFLRNVSSEHALTLARAAATDPGLLGAFTGAPEFHRAVVAHEPFPLAFAAMACRRAAASGDALLLALARLEQAMARARRGPFREPAAPPHGGLALRERAEVLELPEGSVEAAASLRAAIDAGTEPPAPAVGPGVEHALVLGAARPSPHRLADASIELLSPLAGALLVRAREPLGSEAVAGFCRDHDVGARELEPFLSALEAEGVIRRS